MKKLFRKALAMLLCLTMAASAAVLPARAVETSDTAEKSVMNVSGEGETEILYHSHTEDPTAIIYRGCCGADWDNVKYELHKNGALYIYGEGEMKDYSQYGSPFYDNSAVVTVVIETGVTSIGKNAFCDCTGLTSIEIPDSVTSIGYEAFEECTGLTSIEIPDSVTSIGVGAFFGCTGLTSIEIPDSVTSIGYCAFYECEGLTSIEIPDSVTSIGEWTFSGCTGLTSIEIPDSVTSIGDDAFHGCTGLTSIEIPDSVTSIGEWTFSGCTGLTSIEIPDSVTSIGTAAFRGCTGLTSIKVEKTNEYYSGEDGVLFNKDKTKLICYPAGKSDSAYNIPKSVTSIEHGAFYGCTGLTSIEIPDSVTSIGYCAFYGCTGLTSITIPNSVTSIGYSAFYGCTGLTSIEIPDSVTSIDGYAFCNCTGLTDVYYSGTEEQWKKISIYGSNNCLTSATIHYESQMPDSLSTNNNPQPYFIIGKDNNSFKHNSDTFFNDDESQTYLLSDEYYALLLNQVSSSNSLTGKIKSKKDGKWVGSCFGLSVSMVLAHQNKLFDLKTGNDITAGQGFYELKAPKITTSETNPQQANVRNIINYNQLLYDNVIKPDYVTYSDIASNIILSGQDKQDFLKNLVTTAKECSANKKTFIFTYNYNEKKSMSSTANNTLNKWYKKQYGKNYSFTGGHAVVVCSYSYEKNSDEEYVHKLTVCDPNKTDDYVFLEISSDYSSFSYKDNNMSSLETILTSLGESEDINLNKCYTGMKLYYNSIYPKVQVKESTSSISKGNSTYPSGDDSEDNKVRLSVSAFRKFKITNDAEETLICDGENYSGTMKVYSSYMSGENNVMLNLTLNPSSYFKVEELESDSDIEISAEIDDNYYEAIETGADSILLSSKDGININTTSPSSFEIIMSSSLESCDLVKVKGTSYNNVKMYSDNSGIILEADEAVQDISVKTFNNIESNETLVKDGVLSLNVKDNNEGTTEVNVEKEPTHTPGDINGDNKVNMKDLTRLHQYINGWNVTVVDAALDVNGDGKVNMKDLTRLHQYINGWDVKIR